MAKPLLEPLIFSLDSDEKNQVRAWLTCSLHNLREDVVHLFDEICQLTEVKAPLNAATVDDRLLRSYLLDRMEDYLAWKNFQTEREEQSIDIHLLRAYRHRGLALHLDNRLRRQRKRFKKHSRHAAADLYAAYELEELRHESYLLDRRKLDADFNLPNQYLLRAQTAAALRRAAHSLAGARLSEGLPDLPLLNNYLQLVQENTELQEEPGILLYYHLCQYYLPDASVDTLLPFPELIQLTQQNLDGFAPHEQNDLLKLTINQAIRRINQDPNRAHLNEALSLYKLGIERTLLIENNRISVFTFSNIIGISIRLRATDFALDFLEKHAHFLPKSQAPEVIALNRARLAYANHNLDEALLHLQRADYRDNLHLMNARDLQIRIYYENGDYDALRDLIRATRTLINRRKFGYHRAVYRNNLKMISKLVNLRRDRPATVEKFRQEVMHTKPLTERDWILKQL